MATLTPTGASGTGTETLTFDLGANDSGTTKTYNFKLRQTGSSEIADTLTISQAASGVDVTDVTLNRTSIVIGEGASMSLTATVSPSNASDKRISWSSNDTSVATVSSGVVSGVSDGSAVITASSISNPSKSDTCSVRVYADGQIEADDISIPGILTEGSTSLRLTNIQTSTLAASVPSSDTWISSVSIDDSATPIYLRVYAQPNSGGTAARSSTITITGVDMVGQTRTSYVVFTQREPSSSDIACESMSIIPSGNVTMNDAGNTQQFDLSYYPSTTTQHGATWSLTDANGNPVSSSIASLEDDEELADTKHVVLGQSASNSVLKLKATNTYNNNIVSNEVTITATYVSAGNITSDTYSVVMSALDDRNDTTNGAPMLSGTNLSGNIEVASFTGFINTATIEAGRLITTFGYNSGPQREGTVIVRDSGNYSTTAEIHYIQLAYSNPGGNEIKILAIQGIPSATTPTSVKFAINYINNQITSESFTSQTYTLVGEGSNDEERFRKGMQSLSDITVAPRSTEYRVYSIAVDPSGPVTEYKMSITASSVYQNISDSTSGWDGTDIIDE